MPGQLARPVLRGDRHSNVTVLPDQALRSPKRHQTVSGYWHTTNTLRADLRIRSYLTSARAHGIRAIDAIQRALTSNPWLPTITT